MAENKLNVIFKRVERRKEAYEERVSDLHISIKNYYLDFVEDVKRGYTYYNCGVGISRSKIFAIGLLALNKELAKKENDSDKIEYIKELLLEYKGE